MGTKHLGLSACWMGGQLGRGGRAGPKKDSVNSPPEDQSHGTWTCCPGLPRQVTSRALLCEIMTYQKGSAINVSVGRLGEFV